jgi:hypothetical protein
MSETVKPKRALIAYCVLADRLRTGMGIVQAVTPFLAEACHPFSGELFDAAKFTTAVFQRYGIKIPRLAALGLTEQLATEGVLIAISGQAASTVYRYAPASAILDAPPASPVTEAEVESVLQSFTSYCRTDARLADMSDAALQSAFLDRLLHVDSMRLLTRREASIAAKKTPQTMVLNKPADVEGEPGDFRLDFLVSQFLLDLRDNNPQGFERVSNVAFANMAAEAIACFRDPPSGNSSLIGLTVYLDSPLLLDMLGVNVEYAQYGQELLEAIRASGAKAAVFDHCIAEAEGAIHAQLSYLRSGVNQIASSWGTTATPDLLAALIGNVGQRASERLGIFVQRDQEVNLHRKAASTVGDIEAQMTTRMQAWRNADAKEHDRKSVWAMLAIRDTTEPCPRLCDSKWLLLTRNTALVGIANHAWTTWLQGATKHSSSHIERWAPVAVSDKQFAGYLWTRSGGGDNEMSKARLLAHCSAAVRPRADVKARAYNLMLELSGRAEADDLAALMEDREGARALMRATKGDPEDVTRERMPFILEKVKLAAGEFAAEAVRAEKDRHLDEVKTVHGHEIERLTTESKQALELQEEAMRRTEDALVQQKLEQQALLAHNETLRSDLAAAAAADAARKTGILEGGVAAGARLYKVLRWASAVVFGGATWLTATLSATRPELAAGLGLILGIAGFWFVPDLLDGPLQRLATRRLKAVVLSKDPSIEIPDAPPDFRRVKAARREE